MDIEEKKLCVKFGCLLYFKNECAHLGLCNYQTGVPRPALRAISCVFVLRSFLGEGRDFRVEEAPQTAGPRMWRYLEGTR